MEMILLKIDYVQHENFVDVPQTTYNGVKMEDINLTLTVLLIYLKNEDFF